METRPLSNPQSKGDNDVETAEIPGLPWIKSEHWASKDDKEQKNSTEKKETPKYTPETFPLLKEPVKKPAINLPFAYHPGMFRKTGIMTITSLAESTCDPESVTENNDITRINLTKESIKVSEELIFDPERNLFFNPQHRQTVYALTKFVDPLINSNHKQKTFGLYVRPSIGNDRRPIRFVFQDGFSIAHTAGCISCPLVIDQRGCALNPIKHGPFLFLTQRVAGVDISSAGDFTPYEIAHFEEFKMQVKMMVKLKNPNKNFKLIYHLPDLDYIVHMVNFFVLGNISYAALNDFIKGLHKKAQLHRDLIKKICADHNIQVEIMSPFDSILLNRVEIDPNRDPPRNLAELYLKQLGFSKQDEKPEPLPEAQAKEQEKTFIDFCLKRIGENNLANLTLLEVWTDMIKAAKASTKFDKLDTVDSLTFLGNDIVLGCAAKGKENLETLSFVSHNESYIPFSFNSLNNTLQSLEKKSSTKVENQGSSQSGHSSSKTTHSPSKHSSTPQVSAQGIAQVEKLLIPLEDFMNRQGKENIKPPKEESKKKSSSGYGETFNLTSFEPIHVFLKNASHPGLYYLESNVQALKNLFENLNLQKIYKNLGTFQTPRQSRKPALQPAVRTPESPPHKLTKS